MGSVLCVENVGEVVLDKVDAGLRPGDGREEEDVRGVELRNGAALMLVGVYQFGPGVYLDELDVERPSWFIISSVDRCNSNSACLSSLDFLNNGIFALAVILQLL